ncbi:MAG: efflux RND transporter permease subunit [Myxococcales bacterium]|nr:efflux RND transporter permease subunit [Myxococcales bacterium]
MNRPSGRTAMAKWALQTPTLVWIITLALTAAGIVSYLTMSRREDPELRVATALVITIYPGAGADKVELEVTKRLEDEIESMTNLKKLDSISRANISVLFVSVEYDADTDMEWQKLRARVEAARPHMPSSIIGPDIWDNFGDTTAMLLSLTGAEPTALYEIAKDLKSELRSIRAVGEVTLYGEPDEVVYLEARRADMARYGFTPYQVGQMLQLRNLRIPAGAIQTERYQYRLEPTGAFQSLEDIENTIIDLSPTTGQPVHVRDVFTVTRTERNPALTALYQNAAPAVVVGIAMKKGFNVVALGKEVGDMLTRFEKRLPKEVALEVVHDSPRQVDAQISNFMSNLVEGMIIVIVAMTLLMGLRTAIISAVAIPVSVVVTMALMPVFGVDLEMVSIAAFIVALGMLVDNSIIVTDNVDVKIRAGVPPYEASWRGAHEIIRPVVVGTLATVAAFFPMVLLPDEIGAYVRSLPLVVTISLTTSLFVSQTITPMLTSKLLKPATRNETAITEKRMARLYTRFMRLCLRWRFVVLLLTLAALGAGVWMFRAAGFSFFPDAHRDQFTVDIWLKEGSAVAETDRIAKLAEAELLKDPDVDTTLVFVGQGGPRFYITVMPEFQTANYAQIVVNTRDADHTVDVIERFNAKARNAWPGARVFAKKIVMGKPIGAPVEFRISGDDLSQLKKISQQIQEILRTIPGAEPVRDNVGPDVPSLKVNIDAQRAGRVAVTHTDIALAFLSAYEGYPLTHFTDGDRDIPVVLRLDESERQIDDDINNLPVASNFTSAKVPLGSIADVSPQFAPGIIRHVNSQRIITVQAWNEGRLADDIVRDAWPLIQQLPLPEGYQIAIAGEKEEMDQAFWDLTVVFGIILVCLLLLLLFQLRTLRRTLVVLLAIPLSTIGAALGLYLGGYSFSLMAFLGVVSLAGMAIKNAVIWIEFVEESRASGMALNDAVINAGIYRLRPILLTAGTTVGGLLPLALFGGVLFEPMAWAMVVGLSLVTVFALVNVPIFYTFIMKRAQPYDL